MEKGKEEGEGKGGEGLYSPPPNFYSWRRHCPYPFKLNMLIFAMQTGSIERPFKIREHDEHQKYMTSYPSHSYVDKFANFLVFKCDL